jgi:hypothetical protein
MNTKSARHRRAARLEEPRGTRVDEHTPTRTPPAELRTPDNLPDPWLMDTEALLRELDRIRELVNHIPLHGDAAYRAADTANHALWKLREDLRFLVAIHRDGQRRFVQRAEQLAKETANQSRNAASRHGERALRRGVA